MLYFVIFFFCFKLVSDEEVTSVEASWYCFRAKLRIGKRANDWKNATKPKHGQQSRPGLGLGRAIRLWRIRNKYKQQIFGRWWLDAEFQRYTNRGPLPDWYCHWVCFFLGFGSVLGARDQKARDNANNLHTKHTRRIRNIRILNNTSVLEGEYRSLYGTLLLYLRFRITFRSVPSAAQLDLLPLLLAVPPPVVLHAPRRQQKPSSFFYIFFWEHAQLDGEALACGRQFRIYYATVWRIERVA